MLCRRVNLIFTSVALDLALWVLLCILGSTFSWDESRDDEIDIRIQKDSDTFGRFENWLWSDRGVHFQTKVTVYRT